MKDCVLGVGEQVVFCLAKRASKGKEERGRKLETDCGE